MKISSGPIIRQRIKFHDIELRTRVTTTTTTTTGNTVSVCVRTVCLRFSGSNKLSVSPDQNKNLIGYYKKVSEGRSGMLRPLRGKSPGEGVVVVDFW